jgi:hypothetical protein
MQPYNFNQDDETVIFDLLQHLEMKKLNFSNLVTLAVFFALVIGGLMHMVANQ